MSETYNSREENQVFADDIVKPIMDIIDNARHSMDLEKIKGTLKQMADNQSTARAWPFPESQKKADELGETTRLMDLIVQLIEARNKQAEGVINRMQSRKAMSKIPGFKL